MDSRVLDRGMARVCLLSGVHSSTSIHAARGLRLGRASVYRASSFGSCQAKRNSLNRCAQRRCVVVSAQSSESDDVREDESAVTGSEEDDLTAKFMRFVNETKQQWPLEDRWPTPLLSPAAVVRAQMDSLMRNDWPDPDSGVRTAFQFALPEEVERILPGGNHWKERPAVSHVRAWDAAERYLTLTEFRTMVLDPMYLPLVNMEAWEFASPMTFHGKNDSSALQVVHVTNNAQGTERTRSYTFTFCLRRVPVGAFKDCWMVTGLRVGDYANV